MTSADIDIISFIIGVFMAALCIVFIFKKKDDDND